MDQPGESNRSGKKRNVSSFNPVRQEANKPASEVYQKMYQELKELSDNEYQKSERIINEMKSPNGSFSGKTLQKCKILRMYNEALMELKTNFMNAHSAHPEAIELAYQHDTNRDKITNKQKELREEIQNELNELQRSRQ